MTLNFMQQFPDGTPTDFVGKIIKGLTEYQLVEMDVITDLFRKEYLPKIDNQNFGMNLSEEYLSLKNPKLHTIRRGYRWKKGNKIHFKVWKGKPYKDKTFNFAPILSCMSVQHIKFEWNCVNKGLGSESRCVRVFIDGKDVTTNVDLIDRLAVNDGFDNRKDFFNWFNENFEGQIIHWTDLKY